MISGISFSIDIDNNYLKYLQSAVQKSQAQQSVMFILSMM